jgi:cytochrome c-type biogenesis protein CcmF
MEELQYVGEHLWPGRIGQLAITLGFVSALLSALAFFLSVQNQRREREFETWKSIGRWSFLVHGASVFTVIGLIFFIMINQYYEYQYVWAHVSEELPLKYIASAFWEGQEGSFLLWMFWHVVLGIILMVTAGKWESPVMAIMAIIQAILGSMILGVYLLGYKVGSTPMLLLRETMDAPIFANADYLSLIQGNGLNPLLQNYWMTIHPPTLFLGFASTIVPFAFAIAGLWTRDHKGWLRPAMPWALFSAAILGIGILMGGAWAYEALSFGGYWAWDPVENMSLVPWIILVAGIHTHLIARATGRSIGTTYIYYILSFVLIVYSTFLTRSGVLGETSVHAFTEMGLEWQLVGFNLFPLLLGSILLANRYKGIPKPAREESTGSREFWMFVGTLVLLFSALLITASTSLPVFNKIMQFFDPAYEGRVITDPVPHYNKYQLWIAVFIGFLSGGAQYLRYKEHNFKGYARKLGLHLGLSTLLSVAGTWAVAQWIDLYNWQYTLLLFSGLFIVFCNLDYLITFIRGNLKLAGANFSHIGFGVMIVGILASGLNQRVISNNPFVMEGLIEGADPESLRKNILLFKNSPMIMGDYELTYLGDTLVNQTRTFQVHYKRLNEEGEVTEEFDLYPNVLYEKGFTKIAASNPATKHYLTRDIFTHIASLPLVEINLEERRKKDQSLNYNVRWISETETVSFLDTVPISNQDTMVLREFQISEVELDYEPEHPEYQPEEGDLAIGVNLKIRRSDQEESYPAKPVIVVRGSAIFSYPAQINELSTRVRLNQASLERIFSPEHELDYTTFEVRKGERFVYNGVSMEFKGFVKKPEHSAYQSQEGDIAVGAKVRVEDPETGENYEASPIYFIRDNRPFNLKDHLPEVGLHFRFQGLNPQTETVTLKVARDESQGEGIPIQVATDALRSDYIVLEAIEFPGINFFWLGSILMMVGFLISMGHRLAQRRKASLA